jgi:hypothetical protein
LKRPRGKRLTLLIASAALAVVVGAAFESRDLILTAWYAHRLRSHDVEEQLAAIASLGKLRSRRSAGVLVDFLGNTGSRLQLETMRALKGMGGVAMEPLAVAFQRAAQLSDKSAQRTEQDLAVELFLAVLLQIQRKEDSVRSLLNNIGSVLDKKSAGKYLVWKSGVQPIEGRPCRIFLFEPDWVMHSRPYPQTILLTDVKGKVITWKEVSGMTTYRCCELETSNGAVFLVVKYDDSRLKIPGEHTYRLDLRGIEEQK